MLLMAVINLVAAVSAGVAQPVLQTGFNCDQIAFFKSHKTASTTTGATLYRVGVMMGKRFHADTSTSHFLPRSPSTQPADLVINHSTGNYKEMLPHYKQIANKPGLLTIVRDPVSRFISEFYYSAVAQGVPRTALTSFNDQNRMARDLGYGGPKLLDDFLSSQEFEDTVFLIAEKLDEGMAALHLHCGWPIKDLLSIPSNCANCGSVLRRYDGKVVPKATPISEETRDMLLKKNSLDDTLYKRALAKWEAVEERAGRERLADVVAELRRQRQILQDFCHRRVKGGMAADWVRAPGCLWLTLADTEYERTVMSDGYVGWYSRINLAPMHTGLLIREPTNVTVKDMVDAYNRMYSALISHNSTSWAGEVSRSDEAAAA